MILIQFYLQLIVISRAVHGYPLTGLWPSWLGGIGGERLNRDTEGYIYNWFTHICVAIGNFQVVLYPSSGSTGLPSILDNTKTKSCHIGPFQKMVSSGEPT